MNIFLAFPFSDLIGEDGQVSSEHLKFLDNIRIELSKRGHNVFLAHYREKWGKSLMGPNECTPKDYEEMRNTDLVVAFPGSPISGGVHIELGWASSLKKRVCLFLKKGTNYSPLILGLHKVTNVEYYYYEEIFENNILKMISECLE